MRFTREQSSAVLVDVQAGLFPHIYQRAALERNLLILLRGLQILEIPLLVTQQYTKGLGPTIPSIQQALGWASGDTPYIEKIAFSCWDSPPFRSAFEALGRSQVLLAGIEAHICMLQTAVDLKQAGFHPLVIENCASSQRAEDRRIAFRRFHAEGIPVASCESILFELTREAGTETFRAISRLVTNRET